MECLLPRFAGAESGVQTDESPPQQSVSFPCPKHLKKNSLWLQGFLLMHSQWLCSQPATYFGAEVSRVIRVVAVCGREVCLMHQGQEVERGKGAGPRIDQIHAHQPVLPTSTISLSIVPSSFESISGLICSTHQSPMIQVAFCIQIFRLMPRNANENKVELIGFMNRLQALPSEW